MLGGGGCGNGGGPSPPYGDWDEEERSPSPPPQEPPDDVDLTQLQPSPQPSAPKSRFQQFKPPKPAQQGPDLSTRNKNLVDPLYQWQSDLPGVLSSENISRMVNHQAELAKILLRRDKKTESTEQLLRSIDELKVKIYVEITKKTSPAKPVAVASTRGEFASSGPSKYTFSPPKLNRVGLHSKSQNNKLVSRSNSDELKESSVGSKAVLTSRKSDPSSDSSPNKKPPSKPSGSDWIDNNASSRGDSVGVSKPSKFSFKSKSTTTSSVTEIVVDSSSNSSLKESLGERDTESTSSNWRSQGFSFGSSTCSKHEGEKPSTTKTLGYKNRFAQ